jgi:SAM-dependent methyltransferase
LLLRQTRCSVAYFVASLLVDSDGGDQKQKGSAKFIALNITVATTTQINWLPYFKAVRGAGRSATLDAAIKQFLKDPYKPGPLVATDVGAGEGRDTMELLRRGWVVTAIDNSTEGCKALRQTASKANLDSNLTVQETTYAKATYPKVDLVNAYLALPYCHPNEFGQVWKKLVDSIKVDGYLACNLFGNNHTWASFSFVSSFTRAQVNALLKQFKVITLTEKSSNATAADGSTITNHEFFILAKKK